MLKRSYRLALLLPALAGGLATAWAGEADIKIPDLRQVKFSLFGGSIAGTTLELETL